MMLALDPTKSFADKFWNSGFEEFGRLKRPIHTIIALELSPKRKGTSENLEGQCFDTFFFLILDMRNFHRKGLLPNRP